MFPAALVRHASACPNPAGSCFRNPLNVRHWINAKRGMPASQECIKINMCSSSIPSSKSQCYLPYVQHFLLFKAVSGPYLQKKVWKPFILIWQLGKLMFTEVKFFAQGHRASGCRDRGQIQGSWLSGVGVFFSYPCCGQLAPLLETTEEKPQELSTPLKEQEPYPRPSIPAPFLSR